MYDRYWSEYAEWVVSNNNVYFRSCDGAIVALTSGNPQGSATVPQSATPHPEPTTRDAQHAARHTPVATIPYTDARAWAGHTVTVTGTLRYVFNNGKQVLLGFANPHQGAFKVIIRQAHWDRFGGAPERLYHVGQPVAAVGTIAWYQGDPALYATAPEQIRVLNQQGGRDAR